MNERLLSASLRFLSYNLLLQEAEAAERAEPPMVSTCREIVTAVIDYGVEKDDWKKTWKADAQVGPFFPFHLQQDTRHVPIHNMHALVSFTKGQDQACGVLSCFIDGVSTGCALTCLRTLTQLVGWNMAVSATTEMQQPLSV